MMATSSGLSKADETMWIQGLSDALESESGKSGTLELTSLRADGISITRIVDFIVAGVRTFTDRTAAWYIQEVLKQMTKPEIAVLTVQAQGHSMLKAFHADIHAGDGEGDADIAEATEVTFGEGDPLLELEEFILYLIQQALGDDAPRDAEEPDTLPGVQANDKAQEVKVDDRDVIWKNDVKVEENDHTFEAFMDAFAHDSWYRRY